MAAHPLNNPEYLPFKLDLAQRRVLLLRLTHAQRAEAAFLDERALPPQPDGVWCPLASLPRLEAAARMDFVFHIGHCGSTLLARLLQRWPALQVLREPLPLRTLTSADTFDANLLHTLLALWSRPLPPATRTLIKATSSCNGLIAPILDALPGARAVLLDMPLRAYLATILKSDASIADARAAAPERLRDLSRRIGERLDAEAMPAPRLCALGWLAERLRFAALADADGARLLRVDFEDLLARPRDTLGAVAAHVGLDATGLDAALAAPEWRRYSKAQDYGYGREDRAHDLALAQARFGAAIEDGVRGVEAVLAQHPQLAEAVRL